MSALAEASLPATQRHQELYQAGAKLAHRVHATAAHGSGMVERRLQGECTAMSDTLGSLQEVAFDVRRANKEVSQLSDRCRALAYRPGLFPSIAVSEQQGGKGSGGGGAGAGGEGAAAAAAAAASAAAAQGDGGDARGDDDGSPGL